MGLHVTIFRDGYDSTANVFHGAKTITLVDVAGPFDPTDDAPAAFLDRGPLGHPVIRPVAGPSPRTHAGPMFGGTFAYTSDSRFHDAVAKVAGSRIHTAIPIHDRFDTWADNDALSR